MQSGVLKPEGADLLARGAFPEGLTSPLSFKALVLEQWCRRMSAEARAAVDAARVGERVSGECWLRERLRVAINAQLKPDGGAGGTVTVLRALAALAAPRRRLGGVRLRRPARLARVAALDTPAGSNRRAQALRRSNGGPAVWSPSSVRSARCAPRRAASGECSTRPCRPRRTWRAPAPSKSFASRAAEELLRRAGLRRDSLPVPVLRAVRPADRLQPARLAAPPSPRVFRRGRRSPGVRTSTRRPAARRTPWSSPRSSSSATSSSVTTSSRGKFRSSRGRRRPCPTPRPPEDFSTLRSKYGLNERPFALYPAMTWEHKNHVRLLEALARLRDRDGLELPFVFTGHKTDFWPRVERR